MNWLDSKHPIWPIARVLVVLAALAVCLTFGYSSGFDAYKDTRTLVTVGLFSAAAEAVKRMLTS
jgi:hypothetical protein